MDREVGKLVGIIFLIVVFVVVAGFIIYLSISHPERRLDVGAPDIGAYEYQGGVN